MSSQPTGTVGLEFSNSAPLCSGPYLLEPVMTLAGHPAPGARVLDVGCGNGYWSGQFEKRGCIAVGIDPSPSGVEIARATYPMSRFEQMEVSTDVLQRLRERPFDLVISTEVVEHLYDPQAFAAACFAALRPGGRIVVSTPYHGRLKNVALAATNKLDAHHEALRVGGHIKFFSRPTLERLILAAGFRNLQFAGAGRFPYCWKSMLVAAERPM